MTARDVRVEAVVLVVDDESTTRLLTRAALEPAGFAVLEAEGGTQALDAFARTRPDLVLLDVDMPGLDGYAVCEALRAQPGGQYVPIIMVTGREDTDSINRAYQAGATDFIAKPVTWTLLPHRVRYAMRATSLLREVELREQRIARLARITAVLSGINSAIVRIRDMQELLDEACRVAVEEGQFKVAWIGILDPATMKVNPVANAGGAQDYIALVRRGIEAGAEDGEGVVGRTMRGRKPVVSNDIANDESMITRVEAVSRGFRARVGLPLVVDGAAVGVFVLYAPEPGFFDDEEMNLLAELAGDVSFAIESNQKRAKLDYLAYYDGLTGAPNRGLFHERLARLTEGARVASGKLAVVILDIKAFHTINDNLGRHAGDELLRMFARRLQEGVRVSDTVARIGGDQFGLLLTDVANEATIGSLVEKTFASLAEPFLLDGTPVHLSVKGGVTVFPTATDGANADALLTNAEGALKKAKTSADAYLFYAPQINAAIANRLTMESKMLRALEEGQFELYYQPQVDSETRHITGLEALLRWNDPEGGLTPPYKFIPLLEETGMIVTVGRWILGRAMTDRRTLAGRGLKVPRIAVNVSSVQMRQKDFPAYVAAAIGGPVEPGILDIEITESSVMANVEGCIAALREVRAMGIGVSLDDFGTGYSSLSYITQLPANTLKLDKSFVGNMASAPAKLEIVSAVISLGHAHHMEVVAEGVETEEQSKLLRLLRCDHQQGFLHAKPAPLDRIAEMLSGEAALS